ncbi:response regulator [Candidatus Micrarchaeota archaeon]|nr:response regulator [Candidatus Micrarchaeota archaeon]
MPPKLLVVHDEPGVRQLITNTINEHGMPAAHAKFPLEMHSEIRAHKPTHVIIDWQLTDHVTYDLSRIRWPNEAMRRYVMEGRSEQQALQFMRDANTSEPNARQFHQLATQAEVKMPVTGISVAREVLERHPKVKVAIYSYAMEEDLLKNPQYKELQEKYSNRLTNITAHQNGLTAYLQAVKEHKPVKAAKAIPAEKTNIAHWKTFKELKRKFDRLYAKTPYDLDELLEGKPQAIAKYNRIKGVVWSLAARRIAAAAGGTPKQKKELRNLLVNARGRTDFTKHAQTAASIYGSPRIAIKQLSKADRKLSPYDSRVGQFLAKPEIFSRPDHNLYVMHVAQLLNLNVIIQELKDLQKGTQKSVE